jgi:hypothetical protein
MRPPEGRLDMLVQNVTQEHLTGLNPKTDTRTTVIS